ncbi:MAG: phosphotransferase [Pseudomonadota bacterium]
MRHDLPQPAKWGVSGTLIPLPGGHRNRVYRVDGDDLRVVFKSTTRDRAAVEWLEEVHALARRAGFTVPAFVRSADGNLIDGGWTCEHFVPGRPLTQPELRDIARPIDRFHASASDLAQRPGFLSAVDLIEAPAGGDVDLTAVPAGLVELCRDAWRAVADQSMAIVHGDLNPSNLLATATGEVALLDWDECRRDLTLFDLGALGRDDELSRRARLAWEIACSWTAEPDYARRIAARL